MAEILTESFCERCGSRYTFQAGVPRRRGIGRIRTLTRGVKNFVANDNALFAEAMEAAREDEERAASARQLDAFHETFNFCMGCRQYTCRNCWNTDAGECLSCAPDLSRDVLPPPFPRLAVVEAPEPDLPGRDASTWPTSDLRPALIPAVTESFPPALVRDTRADAMELEGTSPGATSDTSATPGPDLDLTPDELHAIQDALARHVGPPAEDPTAPPGTGTPPRVEAGSGPESTIAPAPVDAAPPAPAEPLAEARAETTRLLGRFRPRRERTTTGRPVPATTRAAEVAEPAAAEPVAAILPEVAEPEAEVTSPRLPSRGCRTRRGRTRGYRARDHRAGGCGDNGCRARDRRTRGCRTGGSRARAGRGTRAGRHAGPAARRSRRPANLADGRA